MMGLSDGERILMMRSAVLTQMTRETDRQTDGIGVAYTRYSMLSNGRTVGFPSSLRLSVAGYVGLLWKADKKSYDL